MFLLLNIICSKNCFCVFSFWLDLIFGSFLLAHKHTHAFEKVINKNSKNQALIKQIIGDVSTLQPLLTGSLGLFEMFIATLTEKEPSGSS